MQAASLAIGSLWHSSPEWHDRPKKKIQITVLKRPVLSAFILDLKSWLTQIRSYKLSHTVSANAMKAVFLPSSAKPVKTFCGAVFVHNSVSSAVAYQDAGGGAFLKHLSIYRL